MPLTFIVVVPCVCASSLTPPGPPRQARPRQNYWNATIATLQYCPLDGTYLKYHFLSPDHFQKCVRTRRHFTTLLDSGLSFVLFHTPARFRQLQSSLPDLSPYEANVQAPLCCIRIPCTTLLFVHQPMFCQFQPPILRDLSFVNVPQ